MSQNAVVKRIVSPGVAEVSLMRQMQCGLNCKSCEGCAQRPTDELLALFERVNRAGQTILMVTHSVRAASRAGRVLFLKDGTLYHQLYRGDRTDGQFYEAISDTLTVLATGGMYRG